MDSETVYRSSNGDDWHLERSEGGEATVVRRADPNSGGTETRMAAEEFLQRNNGSPEAQAVRNAST